MRIIETIHDIPASPQQVWDVLIDLEEHASWNPIFYNIAGKAKVGERLEVVVRGKDGGKGMVLTPTVIQVDPAVCFVWRGSLRFPGAFEGTHEFLLEPMPDASTRLVHRERFRGFLVPFVGKVLKDTERGFHEMNQALATEVMARRAPK